jgi:hypothetical protein
VSVDRTKYYEEMGNVLLIHGFKGYFVYMIFEKTWDTLRPNVFSMGAYLVCTFMNGAVKDFSYPWLRSTLILFPFMLALQADFLYLSVLFSWMREKRNGTIRTAPEWPNWRKNRVSAGQPPERR